MSYSYVHYLEASPSGHPFFLDFCLFLCWLKVLHINGIYIFSVVSEVYALKLLYKYFHFYWFRWLVFTQKNKCFLMLHPFWFKDLTELQAVIYLLWILVACVELKTQIRLKLKTCLFVVFIPTVTNQNILSEFYPQRNILR